ncbi:hypothetical protein, partial [Haloferax profundi]|uniref:hypothetical protein n=1 Tax=Haloferax profundi TaxID=1544718 RepID=UPI000B0F39E1
LPKEEVRSLYEAWAEDHGRDPLSPSWFSRKLGNHLEFTTDRRRIDGELVRVFIGFDIDTYQDSDGGN